MLGPLRSGFFGSHSHLPWRNVCLWHLADIGFDAENVSTRRLVSWSLKPPYRLALDFRVAGCHH